VVTRRAAWLALALAGCAPTFEDQTSLVSNPRLLAIQATPPEVALGAPFVVLALYAGPQGAIDASAIDWRICLRQKPLGEPDPVDPGCFAEASTGLLALGAGASVTATMPATACQLFGPDSPPAQPGQPSARPTDPDPTGGFYLPVLARTPDGQSTAALERIACQPSGVTQSVFVAFTAGYHPNRNPALSALSIVASDGTSSPVAPDSNQGPAPFSVSPHQRLSLRASWPSCPASGSDCDGAEDYLSIDPVSKEIVTRRESIVASWYATAGAFDEARNGRGESDPSTDVLNAWTAPNAPGTVHVWVVLRDARGGVGWGSYTLDVR
jgi:hypothetical protein